MAAALPLEAVAAVAQAEVRIAVRSSSSNVAEQGQQKGSVAALAVLGRQCPLRPTAS